MEAVGRSAPFKYRSKSTRRKMFSCFCLALVHRELWVVESIFDLVALRKTIKFIQKHCLAFEQMGWCTTVTSECTAAFFGKTGMRDQQICAGVSLNFISLSFKHQHYCNLWQLHRFMNRAPGLGSKTDADNTVPIPVQQWSHRKGSPSTSRAYSVGAFLILQVMRLDLAFEI